MQEIATETGVRARPGREERFEPAEALRRASRWLPAQGPIKDFVHHNTLHAFQHIGFHDATRAAARLYGARVAMPLDFYLRACQEGRITASALERALERACSEPAAREALRARMLSPPSSDPQFAGLARSGLRANWNRRLGDRSLTLDRLVQPPLFRLIGGYLDQGLSIWRIPGADRLDFFAAVSALAKSSWLPLYPLASPGARELLALPAGEALTAALGRIVGSEGHFETYLLETLLAQPGWSGLVAQCERNPGSLLSRRAITLLDYAAVILVIELGCLESALGTGFESLASRASGTGEPISCHAIHPDAVPAETGAETLLKTWQEAFEWSYYEGILGGILARGPAVSGREKAETPPHPAAWAFFCIDDRECSLRRHVEEVNPAVATFATAGFFGLDFMYRGAGDAVAGKHCPVPVTPRHLVVEERSAAGGRESRRRAFFRGSVLSYALDLGAALRLAANVFFPSLAPVRVPPLSTVDPQARLRLTRQSEEPDSDGFWLGYSIEELADRVQSVLQTVGADERWPELVAFFGHGSSSANNPYFAAYNCGACSGRPGAPNARAFAEAANMPEVRALLRARGVGIPESVWFVGALHDTSLDEVTYFDLDRVPPALRAPLEAFQSSVESALARNAAERCRRFESVPERIPAARALDEVRSRAVSLFEPRPEYNHATNASCIIGRRALTDDLFLDRRAFLHSYDPTKDPRGEMLTGILRAAVPVCGGINLEYYFSRIDPSVYGAGTKLPQNVTGLIGVINGIEGDLLTGLPTQMTEIHDPIRLLMVVEQTPEVALEAARRDPRIFEWIANEWVRYVCVDPLTNEASIFLDGSMRRLDRPEAPKLCWESSLEAARCGRENLPVGFIRKPGGRARG